MLLDKLRSVTVHLPQRVGIDGNGITSKLSNRSTGNPALTCAWLSSEYNCLGVLLRSGTVQTTMGKHLLRKHLRMRLGREAPIG